MIANSAHIPAYRRFAEDFEIVAVCDINEEAAKETAKRQFMKSKISNHKKSWTHHKRIFVCGVSILFFGVK